MRTGIHRIGIMGLESWDWHLESRSCCSICEQLQPALSVPNLNLSLVHPERCTGQLSCLFASPYTKGLND